MENDGLLHVIKRLPMGICPVCGKPLMLLRSEYTAYILAESGYIRSKVDEKSEMKMICPKCGYIENARVGDDGIIPERLDDLVPSTGEIKNNPIGSK